MIALGEITARPPACTYFEDVAISMLNYECTLSGIIYGFFCLTTFS